MIKKLVLGLLLAGTAGWLLSACSPKPPASREDRLKWNLSSLTNAYEMAGHKDLKWDADVKEAFTEFARAQVASASEIAVLTGLAGSAAESAVAAGCHDPMIRYIYARFGTGPNAKPLAERKELYWAAASNLECSAYAPIRKYYANANAAELLYTERNSNVWPVVSELRQKAMQNLNAAFQDPTLPSTDACQAADHVFQMLARNGGQLTNAYNLLEGTLAADKSKAAVAAMVKAEFYSRIAWIARGHGTANQVTEEGWRLFRERLAEAEKALNLAWTKDPYDPQIPTRMLDIVRSQEKSRPEMEKWFQRAMQLDPNNYQACQSKLTYLMPQWYGSAGDMAAFGRECVAHTNWGGRVPLILVDAHIDCADLLPRQSRDGYWLQPEVWPDVKASYERFFQTEPDAMGVRYRYAFFAASCGQWQDFKEQIALIRQTDGKVDEDYFGGKEALERLLKNADSPAK